MEVRVLFWAPYLIHKNPGKSLIYRGFLLPEEINACDGRAAQPRHRNQGSSPIKNNARREGRGTARLDPYRKRRGAQTVHRVFPRRD